MRTLAWPKNVQNLTEQAGCRPAIIAVPTLALVFSLSFALLLSDSYSEFPNTCNACTSGMTLRLLALFRGDVPPPEPPPPDDGGSILVGLRSSLHFRKQLLRSRGIPSITTVETGTNGRSSMPAASMAYS